MKNKTYYHILEHSSYGDIGHQGYYEDMKEAESEVKRLSDYFPNSYFEIFASDTTNEPPITTI